MFRIEVGFSWMVGEIRASGSKRNNNIDIVEKKLIDFFKGPER